MKSIISTIFTGTKVYKNTKNRPSLSSNMVQWGMNNRRPHTQKRGFSLIELMLTTVGILILSAVSYKVIRTQNIFQISAIEENQRENVANRALDQFKRDTGKIDPNWVKLGVPSVFPAPGYGMGSNAYVDAFNNGLEEYTLSDGITFLMTREDRSGTYSILHDLQDPAPTAGTPGVKALYGSGTNEWIEIDTNDVTNWGASIRVGDWVLVYQKGKHALGIVTDEIISPTTTLNIKLRFPDEIAKQITYPTQSLTSSGFVTQPGVVPGNYDYDAAVGLTPLTGTPDDDFINFESDGTFLQVVQPVTYVIEPLTENGGPPGPSNGYIPDAQGNLQPVLVRSQYVYDSVEDVMTMQYEKLANVDELGFTFDVMVSENNAGNQSLDGYLAGEIVRDIGRQSDIDLDGFMNLDPLEVSNETSFLVTPNIVGIRMMVANKWQERDKTLVAENDIKVALDPTFRDVQFQENHFMEAKNSGNVHQAAGLGGTQHIGSPLYFKAPNSQQEYILLPVMDLTKEGSPGEGKLVFMNRDGCSVTSEACSDTQGSTVTLGDDAHQFYPTEVSTIVRDGKTFIVATGMGIETNEGAERRKPMMATIDITTGNIPEILAESGGSGTMCSLEGCQLHVLDDQAEDTSLKDTVNGFVEYNGELYMSSLTKDNNDMGSVKLYKTNVDGTGNDVTIDPFEEVLLDPLPINNTRVVSAIGNETIMYEGNDYLPVCMSRSIPQCSHVKLEPGDPIPPCSHIPYEDGAIYLYDMAGAQPPVQIAEHNYLCTGLQTVGENILVGGRLITQIINEDKIFKVLDGTLVPGDVDFPKLYTDEIYDSEFGQFAEAYFPLGINFPNSDGEPLDEYASAITWNSGTMVQLFPDGRLGVALGNRTIPTAGASLDNQGVITLDMDPGGMQDRIFSNIKTELANLNTSIVSNTYHEGSTTFSSDVVLPGVLYGSPRPTPGSNQSSTIRRMPMVLPLIAEEPMDEGQWKDFFLDYYDPADRANDKDYNVTLPTDGVFESCSNSVPATCEFN